MQRRGRLPPPTHLLALIHRNAWKEVFYELRANGVLWEVRPGYVARMMATGSIFWHHVYEALRAHGKREGEEKMLRTPRVNPPSGAQEAILRVAPGFGWFGLGVLAAGATAWALFLRTDRSPSDGQEPDDQDPDGQEPDVVLDVPELEVDRITLEVRDLRAHVSILAELANLLNISVGVDARLDEVKLEIEGVEAEVHLVARLHNVRAILVKALETIGEHPEILRILARSISRLVRESLEETLGTLDSALEGLEVGETVDEALLGTLGEVRSALEDVLERSDRAVEGAAQEALGEGQGDDTTASP